jgi:hypothetical protein
MIRLFELILNRVYSFIKILNMDWHLHTKLGRKAKSSALVQLVG